MRCSTFLLCGAILVVISESVGAARGQTRQPPLQSQRQFGAPQNQPPPQKPPPNVGDLMRMFAPPPGSDNDMYDVAPQRYQEVTPQPAPVPTQQEVAQMSNEQLQRTVRRAVNSLDDDLDKLATGDQWRKHFELAGLACMTWRDPAGANDAPAREQLRSMAKRVNEARRQPEYQALAQMWGVRALDVLLPEYALGPVGRSHRDLAAGTRQLDDSLGRMNTGASWKEFLETKRIQQLPAAHRDLTQEEADQVRTLAKRYNEVSTQSQYVMIAQLPAFRSTYAYLMQFVDQVNSQASRGSNVYLMQFGDQDKAQPVYLMQFGDQDSAQPAYLMQFGDQAKTQSAYLMPLNAQAGKQLNPQPEPPGSNKVLQLAPQPESSGSNKVLQLAPQPESSGSNKVLQLAPQPEPSDKPTQKGSDSNPQPKPPD